MSICKNCGQEINPDDVFCANCGAKLEAMEEVQNVQAEPVEPEPVWHFEKTNVIGIGWKAVRRKRKADISVDNGIIHIVMSVERFFSAKEKTSEISRPVSDLAAVYIKTLFGFLDIFFAAFTLFIFFGAWVCERYDVVLVFLVLTIVFLARSYRRQLTFVWKDGSKTKIPLDDESGVETLRQTLLN